ncbi:MAG: hypothetical protein AAFW81_11390 [Pseudomonadota bacterium]
MAGAIRGRGATYDVRPAGEYPGVRGLFGFCKDGVQGACAGLLGLLGVTHMTNSPAGFADLHSNVPYLDGVWEAVSAGGIAGPMEMIGAIALFFAARRTMARTLGLVAFVAYLAAYANGYSIADMMTALSQLLAFGAQALEPATAHAAAG